MPELSFGARSVLALVLAGPACRPESPPEPPAPAPAPAAPRARASEPPPRGPEAIVVTIDGIPVHEDDLIDLAKTMDPVPTRPALVLALIERRLIEREAESLGIRVLEHELDDALRSVGTAYSMTIEELQRAVAESTRMTWQQYRIEVAHQLLELKVLRLLMPPVSELAANSDAMATELDVTRKRLVGCLRARARITVDDPSVALPENPFAILTTITGLRFLDDTALPATELEAAAMRAGEGRPPCDSVPAAELAMQQLYLDRGYLDAIVRIPWPEAPQAAMTLDVHTTAGVLHELGELRFDQSAAPAGRRLRERDLLRELRKHAKPGDAAALTTLQTATEAMRTRFEAAGLGSMEVDLARREVEGGVRVDVTFRLLGDPG